MSRLILISVKVLITQKLWRAFKAKVALEGTTIRKQVPKLIEEYLSQ